MTLRLCKTFPGLGPYLAGSIAGIPCSVSGHYAEAARTRMHLYIMAILVSRIIIMK